MKRGARALKRAVSFLLVWLLISCMGRGLAQDAAASVPVDIPALPPLACGPDAHAMVIYFSTDDGVKAAACAAADIRAWALSLNPAKGDTEMKMKIGGTPVAVAWEDNEAVAALRLLAAEGLTIPMAMYGGFEQVGPIGRRLPAADRKITAAAGDIMLYSGNQLVVFYGVNAWAYTRLGRIIGQTPDALRALLGHGDVTISLTIE